MKKQLCALAVLSGLFVAGSAFGQACATFDGSITAAGTFTGNSCTKNPGLALFCSGGNQTNAAGSSIFNVTLGATNNFTIKVTSTTANFNPEVAFIGSPCASTTGCIVDDTNNTQVVGPDTVTGQAAGSYFLIVSDLNTESPGCGDFNVAVVGTLPVTLQGFSVE